VNTHYLAPDEPLSPELVLVFPPELRAQAHARLGPPARPTPRPRTVEVPPVVVDQPYTPSVRALLVARVGQLALIFIAVTILVLAMSIVANAMR
jgi:hypothetical protein